MKKRDLPVFVINHQDLTWRRCFDRPLEYGGESFVSYAHLQKHYILENLRLLEKYPEYRFSIECVATLRHFLKNNPEYKERIKAYLSEGRIHMPFTGHNIVDSNLISGESIIRSYLFGHDYMKENFAYSAEGFDRNDSFGNSAQLPQIARGFNQRFCYNVVYSNLEGNFWRGLDGSIVANVNPKQAAICGGYAKYRPCPQCHGKGDSSCPQCGGLLIDVPFAEKRRFHIYVDESSPQSDELQGYLYVSAEELLPTEEMFPRLSELSEKYNLYFSNYRELAEKFYSERLSLINCPPENEIHPTPEVGFNNTGVYVSRIGAKQKVRSIESRIYGLEALSVMAALSGKNIPEYDSEELWDKILFTMFHDAVTGTMVDQAYDELCDIHNEIDTSLTEIEKKLLVANNEDSLTLINPYGIPFEGYTSVPCHEGKALFKDGERLPIIRKNSEKAKVFVKLSPFSTLSLSYSDFEEERSFHKFAYAQRKGVAAVLRNDTPDEETAESGERFTLENEHYRITADTHGICEIFDKELSLPVAKEGKYKVCEWILEHDEGSPWATLSTDMRRMPISDVTFLVSYEKTEDYQRLVYSHTKKYWGYAVDAGYEIFYSVTLPKGEKKVLFEADVDWDTQNHRLRIAFPTPFTGRSIFEIPYGYIERHPYEPDIVRPHGPSNWAGAQGDSAALGFAGVEGEGASVVLFNRGTPSYKIEEEENGKVILLSVLRSPSVGTYLHEPESYSMTNYDKMRDPGHHHFEFALSSYNSDFFENSAVTDAKAYNSKIFVSKGDCSLPEMPKTDSNDVRISALKPASDKNGFIMRLCEYHGNKASCTVTVPDYVESVYLCDMAENNIEELSIKGGTVTVDFTAFKIKTLRFTINSK